MIILRDKIKVIPYDKNNIDKYKSSENLLKHARVNKNTDGIMLITNSGNLIGYCGWERNWIIALEVCKDYRGRGYGDLLLKTALNSGCTGLTVNKNNQVAISLYKKYGFKPTLENNNRMNMEL